MHCKVEKRTIWCVLCEERPQDRALRRISNRRVVERVDEGRHAEHVREEDKFLAERGTRLAGTSEKVDRAHPFIRGEAACHNHESMGWRRVHGCTFFTSGPAAENDQQDALCLRDELMELADEILEDELNAPILPRAPQRTGT